MKKLFFTIALSAITLNANALQITRNEGTPLKTHYPAKLQYLVEYCSEYANGTIRDGNHSSVRVCVAHDYHLRSKTVNQVVKFKGAAESYQGTEIYSLDIHNDGDDYLTLTAVNDLAKTHTIRKNLFGAFIVE